ncbi:OFA family MFS transporter [Kineothrix sp. MB12-C1]|uniref:OFA family MFS transporter n=1 Tax=Kineothrix sp. MB12-C1 TaxID=3070215 RepID=UPI0027D22283|nr:OFA family MFS transporter [Kineothrix sp. MB12-C1]WMC93176.1 OFA family MFS transporter [Kineothrix sp. MB12-C1]
MKALPNNKWVRAAIPALLLHCSIGTVYCWSLLKGDIAEYIGHSKSEVEWAFSIAIFVLGMSAAFAGHIVEKDIHKSSLISTICFAAGFAGTGLFIHLKSLIGIYICYGLIMGIGLGLGYLSPVKTLMLWFSKQKGLATGLAVAGFGLAKVIASPIMTALMESVGIVNLFYILAVVYFIMMFTGHLLLKKPDGWVEEHDSDTSKTAVNMIKNPTFIGIWLMFYINITCGLALISQEKDILNAMGVPLAVISVVSSLTAIFNAGGRLGFSAAADKLKDRNSIYKVIFILCISFSVITILTNGINNKLVFLAIILLCIVNAGYGGGFSNLPTLLSDRFGMKTISQVHGIALSAWALAGLTGNQLSSLIVAKTGSFTSVLYVTVVLYTVALLISIFLVKPTKEHVA